MCTYQVPDRNPFPNLREDFNYFVKSPQTSRYNCIGWSVGSDLDRIWPDDGENDQWPIDLPRDDTLGNFEAFYMLCGFKRSATDALEDDKEKVAVYVKNGFVSHASRQLANGRWTTKMGVGADAEHSTLGVLEGLGYGRAALILERIRDGRAPSLPEMRPGRPQILAP